MYIDITEKQNSRLIETGLLSVESVEDIFVGEPNTFVTIDDEEITTLRAEGTVLQMDYNNNTGEFDLKIRLEKVFKLTSESDEDDVFEITHYVEVPLGEYQEINATNTIFNLKKYIGYKSNELITIVGYDDNYNPVSKITKGIKSVVLKIDGTLKLTLE